MRAHGAGDCPRASRAVSTPQVCYNPPNLTYPYGAYICVVDVDPGTAVVKVRRFIAVDDCGTRINPMIIEGQIHGGLADGIGMALMEMIAFDEEGNCLGGSLMDYLIPTALEVPRPGDRRRPSRRPRTTRIGAKGVGESATVGSPPAVVNAVVDALRAVRSSARRHAADPVEGVGGHAGPGHPADLAGVDDVSRERAKQLLHDRQPFVHATVVRAQQPTSARAGDEAILLADGTIEGFVGGQCAQSSVRKAALGALQAGESVLLRVLPDGEVHFPDAPGHASWSTPACPVERWRSFWRRSSRRRWCGSAVRRRSPRSSPGCAVCSATTSAATESGGSTVPPLVVIATHGGAEADTIRAALDAGVGYVGLVASRVRGDSVLGALELVRRRTRAGAHPCRPADRCQDACGDRGVDRAPR